MNYKIANLIYVNKIDRKKVYYLKKLFWKKNPLWKIRERKKIYAKKWREFFYGRNR